MPAPKGNKYAVGNRGGGRKSVYHEQSVADTLKKAFVEGVNLGKLKESFEKSKKKKGRIKMTDYVILRAFESDRVLLGLVKKVLPDKVEKNSENFGLAEALIAYGAKD